MKKLVICLLMLCLVFSLAACSGDANTDGTQNPGSVTEPDAAGHPDAPSVTLSGTKLQLFAEAAPVLTALGDAKSVNETPSCAFPGESDKLYTYDSFVVQTYMQDGKEYIYSFWFLDDMVKTDEGIKIGDSKATAEAAYGADTFNGVNAYLVNKDGGELQVILKDDVVSQILYTIVLGQ